MKPKEFYKMVDETFERCKSILHDKEERHTAGDDRLDQFKEVSKHLGCTPEEALLGMFMKHFTNIERFIIIRKSIKPEQWEEAIGDSINYLLLLRGLLVEQGVLK